MRLARAARAAAGAAAAALMMVGAAVAAPSSDGDDQALLADADYIAGRLALKTGDDVNALQRFRSALKRFPDAADLHNEFGFTHRRLRQMDKAFEHYRRALDLNPQHRGAHEYIGEAYLIVGDVDSARFHLAALRAICLLSCDELKDLEKSIADHLARTKPAR